MKKLVYLLPVLILTWACNGTGSGGNSGGTAVTSLANFTDSVSYAQGMEMGKQLKELQVEGQGPLMDPDAFRAGMAAAMNGETTLLEEADIRNIMMKFQMQLQQQQQQKMMVEGGANRAKGTAFLTENATKDGVKTTASGLQYIVIEEGTGATPTAADRVEVEYEGRLIDGTVFDGSAKTGKPAQFGVGQVIKGWTEGLQLMKEGAKYQFFIPAELAYGDQAPPTIGPGQTLVFDVELLRVNPE